MKCIAPVDNQITLHLAIFAPSLRSLQLPRYVAPEFVDHTSSMVGWLRPL